MDPLAEARERAFAALSRRDYSQAELRAYLLGKGCEPENVEQVLTRLCELCLLNDRAYAQRWVDSRLVSRQSSLSALRAELTRKGIDPAIIDEVLSGIGAEAEWANARAFAAKRMKTLHDLDYPVARRRLLAALARRGFPSDVAYRVVAESLQGEPDEMNPC